MSNAAADKDFLRLILQEEEKLGRTLPLDSLIILSHLKTEHRLTTAALTESTQRSEAETRAALEKLVESGLVEAHGTGRGRAYTLSSGVYQKAGDTIGYIRQVGFKPIQHEQMILTQLSLSFNINPARKGFEILIRSLQSTSGYMALAFERIFNLKDTINILMDAFWGPGNSDMIDAPIFGSHHHSTAPVG
jgi:hypothetical protein